MNTGRARRVVRLMLGLLVSCGPATLAAQESPAAADSASDIDVGMQQEQAGGQVADAANADSVVLPPTAPEPHGLKLPPIDGRMQARLTGALSRGRFAPLLRKGSLSVVLIDISDPQRMRYAAVLPDSMRYAASLPKIGIMFTVFSEIDAGRLDYTPELRNKLERMIRRSENSVASELIQLVGFETIERTLRDPRYALYDPEREGGLWVGRGYGSGVGTWKRDPIHHISHGATARQVARFLLLVDRGELVSPWASAEMKRIMGEPEIRHKFVAGLLSIRPLSKIFRKSGTYRNYHADAAIVERGGRKYIAVALLEAPEKGILVELIKVLDGIAMVPESQTLGAVLPAEDDN